MPSKVSDKMTPVRIPPMLREQVEGQREVLGEGETVRQVLEDVTARYPVAGRAPVRARAI